MYESIRGIIYRLLRLQNNWCQYCSEKSPDWRWAERHGCHFIPTTPSPSIGQYNWTVTTEHCSSAEGATFTPFYHLDESVKSHPSKSWGVITGVPTMFTWTWQDTVNWTATHYCAFAEHGAVYSHQLGGCRRLHFALSSPLPPQTPKSNESTRNWCKVTGCPHLAIWTGVQTPEAS